jgi:hypothetical protein
MDKMEVGMEPLAMAFGTALVAAMATDTWQQASSAIASLWHRIRPSHQAASLDEDLATLRARVMVARQADQVDAEKALVGIWQGRVQELLLNYPSLADELQRILDQTLAPMLAPGEQAQIRQVIMTGSSSDESTFNQVAGNQVNYRP